MRTSWVVLTMADRPEALGRALESIRKTGASDVVLVVNGGDASPVCMDDVTVIALPHNVGIPAGRDIGLRAADGELVFFLDDDAEVIDAAMPGRVGERFASEPSLAAVSLRVVDQLGGTARRHTPRPGPGRHHRSGRVVGFLGGACAIRRSSYLAAGGYWSDLFYGHEEIELAWRLIDRGGSIDYLADEQVFHPRASIGRHAGGWWYTGRNRVLIARRTLPALVAVVHILAWLIVGALRAPDQACRRQYFAGYLVGLRSGGSRAPIRWRTVWRLTRLGRPPFV